MDVDQFKKAWEEKSGDWKVPVIPQGKVIQMLFELVAHQTSIMEEMCEHLRAIREATETEVVEDADPNPFQTLNGPIKDPNPLRYGVKGEYGE